MNKQTQTRTLLIVIPILVLVTVLFIAFDRTDSGPGIRIESVNGVWDLRSLPFDDGQRYDLRGQAEYIPGALLTPDEFTASEGEALLGSTPLRDAQFGTIRMRFLLPDDGYYSFVCRTIDFSQRIFVDGELVAEAGSPGETADTNVPNTRWVYLTLKPSPLPDGQAGGIIEIVSHEANFVHRDGGGYGTWTVAGPDIDPALVRSYHFSIILGCFLALFIIHIILFVLLPSYKANLYFALFCLMWFLRTGVMTTLLFSRIFPWLPWTVKFRIEYLTFPVTAVLLVSLLDVLFPGVLQKWFRYAVYGVSAVFAALFLFVGTVFMSHAIMWCYAVYAPVIVYIAVRFIMKLRKVNSEQAVFLAGLGLFFITTILDMLWYSGVHRFNAPNSTTAMLLLTFYQATAVFIGTVREVERAKENEQALAIENTALERINRMRSELTTTISHEMRTPLTVMSSYAQLAVEALREGRNDEQAAANLETISTEAERLAELATGLLEMTAAQNDRDTDAAFDLGDVVRQMAGLCEPTLKKQGNRLTLDIHEGLPKVYGSAGEFTQVLWNLMNNSAAHTKDGEINISVWNDMESRAVVVDFADTGSGIPPELLQCDSAGVACVFDRGVSGSGSTGVGLAVCKEIIEKHGGSIGITSEPGKGTTVTFEIPAISEESK